MRKDTVRIVKSTIPALQKHADQITQVFYGIMLEEFPQVRPLFNQANQADGAQPRALANAILAFAHFIDNPQILSDTLWRVGNKHASLFVQPDQYDIVGQCLLRAIGEVLGEAATDEVIDAWADAYQYLANLLIDIEEYVYQVTEHQPGGWRGTRRFRVSQRQDESEGITSFYLVPVDEGEVPHFRPGQYIAFDLDLDGRKVRRNYSLSCAPGAGHLRVTIKHVAGGLVSSYFHERVFEGHELDMYPPCGDFVLDDSDTPLVLVSGGVGITPTMSMLDHAVHTGRDIVFLHASKSRRVHPFREHVKRLAEEHPQLRYAFVYSEAGEDAADIADTPDHVGRIDGALLARYLPRDRSDLQIYFLGPKPFMQSVYRSCVSLGVPAEQLRYEFFGPAQDITQMPAPAVIQPIASVG